MDIGATFNTMDAKSVKSKTSGGGWSKVKRLAMTGTFSKKMQSNKFTAAQRKMSIILGD